MEDIKDKEVQSKPKLDIKPYGKIDAYEINYSGSVIFTTKEIMKKISDQFVMYEKKIIKLTSDINLAKKEIQSLRSELDASKRENEKLKGRLESFVRYQGNGRPPVLSEEHKKTIRTLCEKKMNISDIHKALILNFGFKGNYETVRKYIRDSENAKAWQ